MVRIAQHVLVQLFCARSIDAAHGDIAFTRDATASAMLLSPDEQKRLVITLIPVTKARAFAMMRAMLLTSRTSGRPGHHGVLDFARVELRTVDGSAYVSASTAPWLRLTRRADLPSGVRAVETITASRALIAHLPQRR
jgi:hypothetical protein